MRASVVAGPAGAGKSTLGAALARRDGAVLLDLDTLTNPLLDALAPRFAPDGHWNVDALRPSISPARYATLYAVAADQVALGHDVVLVAPFTAALAGGEAWEVLVRALAPADVRVVWLDLDPAERTRRMIARGAPRDHGSRAVAAAAPVVPHVRVDGALRTEEQLALL